MDPQSQFCPNPSCQARGKPGQGNITIHSRKENRYHCKTCDKTFSTTTGTPFYRLQTAREVVTIVITLLCVMSYFLFSFELKNRLLSGMTVWGRWLLMIGFGARLAWDRR